MKLHDATRDYLGRCMTEQDAWSLLRRLCEEVGMRLSGSEEEKQAAEIVRGELSHSGLATSVEEFSYTGWRPGRSSVRIQEGRLAR